MIGRNMPAPVYLQGICTFHIGKSTTFISKYALSTQLLSSAALRLEAVAQTCPFHAKNIFLRDFMYKCAFVGGFVGPVIGWDLICRRIPI